MIGSNTHNLPKHKLGKLPDKELLRVITKTGQEDEPMMAWLTLEERESLRYSDYEYLKDNALNPVVRSEARQEWNNLRGASLHLTGQEALAV